jgi:hypothetical protein
VFNFNVQIDGDRFLRCIDLHSGRAGRCH